MFFLCKEKGRKEEFKRNETVFSWERLRERSQNLQTFPLFNILNNLFV